MTYARSMYGYNKIMDQQLLHPSYRTIHYFTQDDLNPYSYVLHNNFRIRSLSYDRLPDIHPVSDYALLEYGISDYRKVLSY